MTLQELLTPELLKHLPSQAEGKQVWLVGGAVRDHFLQRQSLDLDFVVAGDALSLARRVADGLGGKYYTLDLERGAGRVLVSLPGGEERILDFTRMQGSDLQEDLGLRDFTINALALDPHHLDELIDPEGGLKDLKDALLRACRSDSIERDPVRALRAVRIASEIEARIDADTIEQIKGARALIIDVSAERLRDEIFRMLENQQPARPLRLLEHLSIFDVLFQEFSNPATEGSYRGDFYEITQRALVVISRLGELFQILAPVHDPEAAADLTLGFTAIRLGRYRQSLSDYLGTELSSGRTQKAWILLGCLFSTYVYQYFDDAHNMSSEELDFKNTRFAATAWTERYHVSRKETMWLDRFLDVRVPQLPSTPGGERDLQIYRYFQQTQNAGPGLLFSDLAGFLVDSDGPPSEEQWESRVGNAFYFLEAYFERKDDVVDVEPLLSGEDIISAFNLPPGPMIGDLLHRLVEVQVAEKINTRDQALDSIRDMLAGKPEGSVGSN